MRLPNRLLMSLLIATLFFSTDLSSQTATTEVDSLFQTIPTLEGKEKLLVYSKLAEILQIKHDKRAHDIGADGYAHFLTLANKTKDQYEKGYSFLTIQAAAGIRFNNLIDVVHTAEEIERLAKEMEPLGYDTSKMISTAYYYRAIITLRQEKNEKSLELALKGLSHVKNPDTNPDAIQLTSFIASRYSTNDIEKANEYFDKALILIKAQYKTLQENNANPLEITKVQTRIAGIYYNRGEAFIRNKKDDLAISDLQNSLSYSKDLDHPLNDLATISLCNVYSRIGRDSEAVDLLKNIEPNVTKRNILSQQHYFYEVSSKINGNIGDFKKAYESQKTYAILNDSFHKINHNSAVAELETKYDTHQKENEITQLQSSNKISKSQNLLLLFLLGALSLFGGLIYFQNRQKKKFADKIIKKDKEVLDLKENFFINITHQLRTPLSLIIAPLKEVQNSSIDDKSKLKVDQALKNSDRLLELFNQLLDWNKMEAHALKLTMQQADITETLQSIFDRYNEFAKEKNITFTHELPKGNIYGEMDFDKVEKVLGNLISNALKFTPKDGRVILRSKLDNNKLRIEVEDNGIGIKAEDIDKVFDKYYQAGDGSNGFGFGLTFANELTKLMGGSLSAHSTSSVKTVFELTLPFTRLETLPKSAQVAKKVVMHNPIINESSLSLLIVEDNIELNNYLSSYFDSQYTIISALNKKEAFDLAYEHAPDIILCDVMLPDGNGFEVLDELKNNASTSHIPVLMLTAKTDEKSRKEGWDKGADGYLSKPFDPAELNSVINNLLVNRQKVQEKFITLSDDFIADKTPEVQDPFMENLLKLLNENIGNEYYSIDDLAANFPMNRTHFFQKVKAISGSTPKKLFRELRLKKARNYITSGIPPKEAAIKTGFVSLSHFSRSYKSFFKENPSETFKA